MSKRTLDKIMAYVDEVNARRLATWPEASAAVWSSEPPVA